MTLVVTHSTVTGAAADSDAMVDGVAWDANHTLTGTISASQGGTGVANNDSSTLTISGSYGTTFTVTATTSVTLPTTGTLATLAGTETLSNKTLTAVDGSAAAPSFSFVNDTDNGFYLAGTNILGVSTAGTVRSVINASGEVGIPTAATGVGLGVNKTITGATTSYGIRSTGEIQSGVTSAGMYFNTSAATQATSFTCSALHHYNAAQGTVGAGSTVTAQYGFSVDSTLTGATTNYGFYGNLAASGSARWNLYANGTAPNYIAGALGIGTTAVTTGTALRINRSITGATSINHVLNESTVASDVTTATRGFASSLSTANASFTLGELTHYFAAQATIGAASTVTTQIGFSVSSSLTGATNNYGFYGNISSASGRWNFYANGTARNYMNGALSIGATTDPGTGGLFVNGVANVAGGTATPAGGSTSARLLLGTTAGFGIYYGSGAPSVSAAQGSIYIRSDGSSTSTRLYVNTDGSTTWTNFTSAT